MVQQFQCANVSDTEFPLRTCCVIGRENVAAVGVLVVTCRCLLTHDLHPAALEILNVAWTVIYLLRGKKKKGVENENGELYHSTRFFI